MSWCGCASTCRQAAGRVVWQCKVSTTRTRTVRGRNECGIMRLCFCRFVPRTVGEPHSARAWSLRLPLAHCRTSHNAPVTGLIPSCIASRSLQDGLLPHRPRYLARPIIPCCNGPPHAQCYIQLYTMHASVKHSEGIENCPAATRVHPISSHLIPCKYIPHPSLHSLFPGCGRSPRVHHGEGLVPE